MVDPTSIVSDPSGVLDYIKGMGALGAVVFAVLFWLERGDRKAAEKQALDITLSGIKALNGVEAALKAIGTKIGSKRRSR